MNKVLNFLKNNLIIVLYSLIELVICVLIVFDVIKDVNTFNYLMIVLNFVVSIIIFIINENRFNIFLTIGMFFTCLADYNLVVLGKNYELGVVFFTFAQLSYMLMLKTNYKELLIRLIVIVFLEVLSLIIVKDLYSFLVFITMFYLSIFISNIIFGFIKKLHLLFLIGMILYLLCDICVGVSSFELFQDTSIAEILGRLIFYFYIPGLYLMILASYIKNKKEKYE